MDALDYLPSVADQFSDAAVTGKDLYGELASTKVDTLGFLPVLERLRLHMMETTAGLLAFAEG